MLKLPCPPYYAYHTPACHVLMKCVRSELPSEIFHGWANVCLANPISDDAKFSFIIWEEKYFESRRSKS